MSQRDRYIEAARRGAPLDGILVVDVHAHLGEYNEFHMVRTDAASMIEVMNRIGIDVAMPSAHHACLGADVVLGNDLVLEAMAKYPGRILGYASFNPNYPDEAVHELERCLDAGMVGIKIHSGMGVPYTDPGYRRVYELAAARRVPILAHAYPGDLGPLEQVISEHPKVNWILGHSGVQQRERYVTLARRQSNVWLEICTSSAPHGIPDYFVEQGVGRRVLWGSDQVFLSAAQQVGKALCARMSPAWKERILGRNAARLFPQVGRMLRRRRRGALRRR